MITRLEIEGFKAFGARQIATLAPITLIYGTNSLELIRSRGQQL